jgi:hypothetical protein
MVERGLLLTVAVSAGIVRALACVSFSRAGADQPGSWRRSEKGGLGFVY